MKLSKKEMLSIIRAQLAIDLNCTPDDFDRDGFVFCEAKENPGRRPFPRGERHFEMITMGSAVIISATPDLMQYVREQLDGKDSNEAFNMPFVHGLGICYIPDNPRPLPTPDGIEVKMIERDEIVKLYDIVQRSDFPYVFNFDINHPRPDILATLAMVDGEIVGIAGVSADCDMMWQIGLNVLPGFRNRGIAAALTSKLTIEVLERGKIPYYATAAGNIASQRVAHCTGFTPAWACVYRGRFNGELTLPTS